MPPITTTPAAAPPSRLHPFLLALFVGSGCSALIYEIVWFQLLQLVVGSTAVSLGVLLGTFMGGMCLGSLLLSRYVSRDQHPLKVYALLELGIGVCGQLVLFGVPLIDGLYAMIGGQGTWGLIARAIVCVLCLLVPTFLMGATLPAVARWVETTPQGISWLGFFYGGNIAGAVVGCLLAGFYLLRVYDMSFATYVAVAINAAVAGLAYLLAQFVPYQLAAPKAVTSATDCPSPWPVYVTIALSGAGALGAEVVWTRLLSLQFGGTVYTFSIILAVFLVGLGLGSTIGAALGRQSANPRVILGGFQTLLSVAILWAAYQLIEGIPYWPVDKRYAANPSFGPWLFFQIDFIRCLWCIFPAAFLWGASFPLALAGVSGAGSDAGKLVGRVYAANTVGAIVGAVVFSIFLVKLIPDSNDPRFTTRSQIAQVILIVLAATAAVVSLLFPIRTLFSSGKSNAQAWAGNARLALIPAAIVAAIVTARWVPETPWQLIAYGRDFYWQIADGNDKKSEVLFVGEGMNSSVAVIKDNLGDRNFYVSGKIEASSTPQDMKLQRMLGHIPALVHPNPKSVLVVGCGAGVTAGSFLVHPSVERVVICEIEPLIPQKVTPKFHAENYGVAENHPKVEIVYDDARHFMLTATEKFDIITSDPIHPWVKGAATLYTKEYFELVKKRLNPGGLVTQWVPLYQSSPEVVKSEVATFFAAFPDASVWGTHNERNPGEFNGYDTVMLGHIGPIQVDLEALKKRYVQEDHLPVSRSLQEVEFFTIEQLIGTYACRAADMTEWLKEAEINHDRNLRLQYLAGLSLAFKSEIPIYDEMRRNRKFPDDLFLIPEEKKGFLKTMLGFGPQQ